MDVYTMFQIDGTKVMDVCTVSIFSTPGRWQPENGDFGTGHPVDCP